VAALQWPLRRWDRDAAASADLYLANSTVVAERIKGLYGIEAEIVPPPPALRPDSSVDELDGLEPGFVLCVSRLLPYKNVDAVVQAFASLPAERLVVVVGGPEEHSLRSLAGSNVRFVGRVSDPKLCGLYAGCRALVAASHEDFGLTPLEAAGFGKPTAALRFGGFLDTVSEGETGVFFDEPTPAAIAEALRELLASTLDEQTIRDVADRFSELRFIERLRTLAAVAS